MNGQSKLEHVLSRPNRLIIASLVLLTGFAWLELFSSGSAGPILLHHAHHAHLSLAQPAASTRPLRESGILLVMWLVMAVAMMLPTAAPAILSFADVSRAAEQAHPTGRTAAFVLGYLFAWSGFAALAAATQLELATAGHYLSAFKLERPLLGAAVLIGAGLYQFSALKEICLTQCRSPMMFFLAHWRDGARGAMYLGLRHGIECVGCCWALMALMLFAGATSVAWTAGLSALMLTEKIAPGGRKVARAL